MKIFKDYPDFQPNLTPRDIFELGSFGGTYWRPIYSSVTGQNYKNIHLNEIILKIEDLTLMGNGFLIMIILQCFTLDYQLLE